MAIVLKRAASASCALAIMVWPLVSAAQDAQTWAKIDRAVDEASLQFGLPRTWISQVIAAESGGRPGAISPAGAMGLMQLMPGTWSDLQVELGLGPNPFDIHDNVLGGAAYLREMLDRFGPSGFLAAYHSGPARYARQQQGRGTVGPATRKYVANLSRRLELPLSAARRDWTCSPLFP